MGQFARVIGDVFMLHKADLETLSAPDFRGGMKAAGNQRDALKPHGGVGTSLRLLAGRAATMMCPVPG